MIDSRFDLHDHKKKIIDQLGLLDFDGDPRLKALIEDLAKHYGVDRASIDLDFDGREHYLVAYGFAGNANPFTSDRGTAYDDTALSGRQLPIIVPDCRVHPVFSELSYVANGATVFLAFVGLNASDGTRLGSVSIDDSEPHEDFSLHDAQFLVETTAKVAQILGLDRPIRN